MAGISAENAKLMLDWSLGGATPTRPTAGSQAVGLSTGVPTSVSSFEVATGSGVTRQIAGFAAAASPAGSASNGSAMTFGPFSGACTISSLHVWATNASAAAANMLYYGALATARTLGVGDSLVFNAGALVITLS